MSLPPDHPLDVDRVARQSWIDHAHDLHEAGSTNDAALARAAASPPDQSELFVTNHQPNGRGRGDNTWWSPPGALAFSLLTRELRIDADRLPQASLAVGVAVCEALEDFLPTAARLKWPNDVFVEGKKACGVLIEGPAASPRRLVIGVGINVNNPAAGAPEELRGRCIAMVDAAPAGAVFDRTEVLLACVERIGAWLIRLEEHEPGLPIACNERSLLTGRRVRVELPTRAVEGEVVRIAEDGALVVSTPGGPEKLYGGVVSSW